MGFFKITIVFLNLLICVFVCLLGTVQRSHSARVEVGGQLAEPVLSAMWYWGSNSSDQARCKKPHLLGHLIGSFKMAVVGEFSRRVMILRLWSVIHFALM